MESRKRQPWFALKVRTRGELLVSSALQSKTFETFVPTWKEFRRYTDRVKTIDAAMFPGYLFCRLDPLRPLRALETLGVAYIIGADGCFVPVPDEEITALQRLMAFERAAKPWPYLRKGAKVRVEFGALAGVEGWLIAEKGIDRLVLSVEILQRSVAVEIDREWIRPMPVIPAADGALQSIGTK